MKNKKAIGHKLRELRGEKTMQQVADDIGISKSAINMYENGERIPRDEIKVKFAKYYGLSVEAIFFDCTEHI